MNDNEFDQQSVLPAEHSLNISWEELHDAGVTDRVEQMRAARQVPLVRAVGAPEQDAPSGPLKWLRGSIGALTLSGLVGSLFGWAFIEVALRPDADEHWYGDAAHTGNILFSVVIALTIGLVISAWEGVEARSFTKAGKAMLKAAPVLLIGGVLGGYIASEVYQSMTSDLLDDAYRAAAAKETFDEAMETFEQYVSSHLHLPRGLAIGLVGIAVGAALGASSLSARRAVNGAVGGFVGGFLGGFVFDYVSSSSESGVLPRLVAMVVIGVLIGASMGLIETARREHWLEILSGGMAGKQFILYHQQTIVGSDASCPVTLIKDPGVAPQHVSLSRAGDGLTVRSLNPAQPAYVNGRPVQEQPLSDSDTLQLGSTVLRYRSKDAAPSVAGAIYG